MKKTFMSRKVLFPIPRVNIKKLWKQKNPIVKMGQVGEWDVHCKEIPVVTDREKHVKSHW